MDEIALERAVRSLEPKARSVDNWCEWLPDALRRYTATSMAVFTCGELTLQALDYCEDQLECDEQVLRLQVLVEDWMRDMARTGHFLLLNATLEEGRRMQRIRCHKESW